MAVPMRMVVMVMIVSAAATFVMRVIMTAVTLRMIIMMIVIVPTAAGLVMSMIMAAGAVVVVATAVLVIMVVFMVMPAAIRCLMANGGQVENAEHEQADAGDQCHRAEDAIRWQVVNEATADMEVEHHAAPEQQQGNADEMIGETLGAHKLLREVEDHLGPGAGQGTDDNEQAEEHGDDHTALEYTGIHEHQLDVHHRTKDQEGQLRCGIE